MRIKKFESLVSDQKRLFVGTVKPDLDKPILFFPIRYQLQRPLRMLGLRSDHAENLFDRCVSETLMSVNV